MNHLKFTFTLAILATSIACQLATAETPAARASVETGRSTTTVQTVPAAPESGQTVTTTTTTNTGLISEVMPDGFLVRTDNGAPTRYFQSENTVYVDEAGRPVARELV